MSDAKTRRPWGTIAIWARAIWVGGSSGEVEAVEGDRAPGLTHEADDRFQERCHADPIATEERQGLTRAVVAEPGPGFRG